MKMMNNDPEGNISKNSGTVVSIIIPCLNEEEYIEGCLNSLLENDYDRNLMEILVVDGMSKDRSRSIISEYCRKYEHVKMLDNPSLIIPTALNIGINNASGEIIMRVDAHAVYARDYISKLVSGLSLYKADNIGGIYEPFMGRTKRSRAIGIVFSHPFAAGNAYHRIGSDRVREAESVFGGCYRRDVFQKIGLFNEKLARVQDREFNRRLRKAGGVIILDPSVRCVYIPRQHIRDYAKFCFRSAYWLFSARCYTDVKLLAPRNMVPPAFVIYSALAFVSLPYIRRATRVIVLMPVLIYAAANVYFSSKAAAKEGSLTILPLLALLFFITHYGYGIGAIAGSVKSIMIGRKNRPSVS